MVRRAVSRLRCFTQHLLLAILRIMQTYEIEMKSLLGSPESARALRAKMAEIHPGHEVLGTGRQRNHYFTEGPMDELFTRVSLHVPDTEHERLRHIIGEGKNFSVRTRETDDETLFVIKASIDDTTSENGIARIEFEVPVPLTLEELDRIIVEAGFPYQAKWSREREEYRIKEVTVTIDRNAGYGYVAEFEKVVHDPLHAESTQRELRALMDELGVEELAQDRLERMFAYYNEHWQEYYGTDKIFTI
jgi:adenylate cyclase class IV